MYDVIVVGGGPAGMSASIYTARKKLKTLLLTEEFGGQAAKSGEVENYLGFKKLSGAELTSKFQEHIETIGVETKTAAVESINKLEKGPPAGEAGFEVKSKDETFQAKSIIITSGKVPRPLNIPGEKEFLGKGISYCATCDGPLFSNKTVAVIGGGNSALDAAIELEKHAAKVYILNLNPDFQGDEIRKDHVRESKKIGTISEAEITEVNGDQVLKGLKYKNLKSNEIKKLTVDGIFVEIGWTPATEPVKDLVDLDLNDLKEIKIDGDNQTSIPGIFAAGDVTSIKEKQIIIAAGEGAKAALAAWKYLVTNKLLN